MNASVAPPAPRHALKKLRFFLIFLALGLLGLVSFAFGMFMAVASDLPKLEAKFRQENAHNSVLLDDRGVQIGMLSERDQVLVTPQQIPPIVREAVISIEDKRFETNSGVDLRSIARAFVTDVLHQGAVQGASTIEQQFVKNALPGAQAHRTIAEKLRETALAFWLAHHWSKRKILTEYLNTIYFGNGAYGIEAAAQTYFGQDVNHRGCGLPKHPLCVQELEPWEAALLAGIIQSPTGYDPVTEPTAARVRRNVVLQQMYGQGYLNRAEYEESTIEALPAPQDVEPPQQPLVDGIDTGYFDSWVGQQVIARYGAERTYYGGLQVHTTLDLALQRAAEAAVAGYLGSEGPTAALVAIENGTGKVRAMVGGRGYDASPFNLATEGERQPGSSFKAFDLAAALEDGISPDSVWSSRVKTFKVPHSSEVFTVHNDENAYSGSNTLVGATAFSDNSIYAEVGLQVGTHRIASLAHKMGITTPISTNPAMTIGGLKTGVTPLDMAHSYETLAHGGERVSGTLGEPEAPVGIEAVGIGQHTQVDHTVLHRVLPAGVASTETEMLETVLAYGTGRAAALGQFAAGKTGTTSNYGDAWFVGWDHRYTVAVWVGFPNSLVPMTTEFNGTPVLGGTFPALIWHNFMVAAVQVERERSEEASAKRAGTQATKTEATSPAGPGATTTPATTPASPTPNQEAARGGAKGRANAAPTTPAGGEQSGTGSGAESSEGAQAPAQKSPAAEGAGGSPSNASPPTSTPPGVGGTPNQAPAPKVSGGTGAPSGGSSPEG
ncbi:MAG: transglycosylase domain-containing protein [Solirubrobacteraceae bacterium]